MGFFSKSKPDPEQLLAQGMQHLQGGQHAKAIEAFAGVVAIQPQHGHAWYCKGCAHRELNQYQEAIEAFQTSAQHAGDRASLPLYNLGNIFQELEQFDQAIHYFRKATEADPTMADGWINLGRLLDDSGEHAEAIGCYDTALKHAPDDAMAWSNRGNSLRALERWADALESYQTALGFDEEDLAARMGAASCKIECGQPDEGISELTELAEETSRSIVAFELATALAKVGRHEGAVGIYDMLIENDFVSAQIFNNRGECLAKLGQIDAALASFDNAMALDPTFAPAMFGKARVLINAERIDEAKPIIRNYLEHASEAERSDSAVQAMLVLCGITA